MHIDYVTILKLVTSEFNNDREKKINESYFTIFQPWQPIISGVIILHHKHMFIIIITPMLAHSNKAHLKKKENIKRYMYIHLNALNSPTELWLISIDDHRLYARPRRLLASSYDNERMGDISSAVSNFLSFSQKSCWPTGSSVHCR